MDNQFSENETVKHVPAANEEVIENEFKRKYDIIIFGASGFTGQFVVKDMAYFSHVYNLTWAVAGRNTSLLQKTLDDMYKTYDGVKEKIDIIYADVQDIKSIMQMTKNASVVINCVGPYYMFGETVVRSCVLNSTHYVDITGEPLFMEKMVFMYNNQAEKNQAVIVSALGMESVPADMGVEYLYKHFDGELHNVDIYLKLYSTKSPSLTASAAIHETTWISVVLLVATEKELRHYRNLLDESMGITRMKPNISKVFHKQQINMHSDKKHWCIAFTEPDQSVIVRSIHHAKTADHLPYNFYVKNYLAVGSLITTIGLFILFVFFLVLAKIEPIRNLFVRFPKLMTLGFATKTGPNKEVMENSQMLLTLIGYGSTSTKYPNTNSKEIRQNSRKTIINVKAKNPGYGFTSKAVVLGAITILKDRKNIKGGVLTPASAFRNTQYIDRLIKHNAAIFEVESDLVIYDNTQN